MTAERRVQGPAANGDTISPYLSQAVVAQYAAQSDLQPPEQLLFAKHIKPGARILDLGIGAGRTSPHLAAAARRYVGVDCVASMVQAAKLRFPNLDLRVGDAADLSDFPDASFDAVVFSFNGLGHLFPDVRRAMCLKSAARVLAPEGIFIFSLHNSASLFLRPQRVGAGLAGLVRGAAQSAATNAARSLHRLSSRAYWSGEGYLEVKASPPITVFLTQPHRVKNELSAAGLTLEDVIPDTHPRASRAACIRWYYYAARRV